MGKRGPARVPSALLTARGSWLPGTRKDEPEVAEPMVAEPPVWLTNDAALECWGRYRPLLTWMRKTDENLFARYCEAWGRYHTRLDELAGAVVKEQKESLDARLAKLNEQLLRMEAQIGLTPSARTGIRADDKPKNSKKIRLIQGQRAKREA